MTRALLIAIGNRLRRDDGVAHEIAERFCAGGDLEWRAMQQLTPELAEEITRYDRVVFLDADARATELSIEPVREEFSVGALAHVASAGDIVGWSRVLFGFAGRAFLCRIPAYDFSVGEGLSDAARAMAGRASRELEILLGRLQQARRR